MAGLGRKDFQAGAVLSAADVDGYLMDQSVMKFANTSAAGSAYGTAIAEGMNFYLSDTDEVVFHNGTSFVKQKPSENAIINGAFDFWQRGTSGSNTGAVSYTADRWSSVTYAGGTMNWSQQSTSTKLFNSQYCARVQRPSGATNTATMNLGYSLETKDSLPLRGKTVTLSFWARAGANYSPSGSVLNYTIFT